jgi:hypothetical protein
MGSAAAPVGYLPQADACPTVSTVCRAAIPVQKPLYNLFACAEIRLPETIKRQSEIREALLGGIGEDSKRSQTPRFLVDLLHRGRLLPDIEAHDRRARRLRREDAEPAR